jgi:hypothetical protein
MKCQLCDDKAVAIFDMPEGCACSPEKTQALCTHHALKASPQAGMMLIKDLTEGERFTDLWVNARVFPEPELPATVQFTANELRVLSVLDAVQRRREI